MTYAHGQLDLGQLQDARATIEGALAFLLEQLARAPQDAQMRRRSGWTRVILGRILELQGHRSEAREQWRQADEAIAPLTVKDDRLALEIQVEALVRLGRIEEARPLAVRLLRLSPTRDVLELLRSHGLGD